MLIDKLVMLRGDGSSSTISDTEAGATSLVRDATTGKVVVPINKTGRCGLPVVAIVDGSTIVGRVYTITIEASDAANFGSGVDVVATFPTVSTNGTQTFIRRIHTQKKYIRSVITKTTAGVSGDIDALIFVTTGLMDT